MKLYYGWCIVAISACAMALSIGASIQAFGLFVLPVSTEFRLNRAEINTGAILFNLGMAVVGPFVGRLLDRGSAKLTMAACGMLFGASLVALGLSHNIWLSAAVVALPLAAGAVGAGTVTSPALVARWFTAHRARAMAIAMTGISLGPVVVVPLIGILIEAVDWRSSLLIVGSAIGVLLLLLAMLVRERPQPADVEVRSGAPVDPLEPRLGGDNPQPLSIGELLRLPQFWTMALSISFAFGILQVVIVSLVPYAQGRGLSLKEGASLVSMYGGSALIGALLLAWLGDRFDRMALMIMQLALFALSGAALLFGTSYMAMIACIGVFGVLGGMITPTFLALLADRFGAASFGTANGTASFLSTMISAGCIRAAGEMFDRTGSYRLTFMSIGLIGALAVLLMLLTNPVSRRLPVTPSI